MGVTQETKGDVMECIAVHSSGKIRDELIKIAAAVNENYKTPFAELRVRMKTKN